MSAIDVSGWPNHPDTEHDVAHGYPRQLLQDHLQAKATQLSDEAESLPHGRRRDALLHRAHQMKTASQIVDRWLSSPGLRALR